MQSVFLITALGNYGEKYSNTRHNAGWIVLDFILQQLGLEPQWQLDKKHQALVRKTDIVIGLPGNRTSDWGRNIPAGSYPVIFCKPQTYMNLSGNAVQSIAHYHKISNNQILIIHDDLDQKLGEIKYKRMGGSGGQNGIKHITEKLGNDQYYRLKIGIGRPDDPRFAIIDWVMHSFSDDEKKILYNLTSSCIHTIGLFLQGKN